MAKNLNDLKAQQVIDEIVLSALKDESFRKKLKTDPEQALKGADIPADPAQIAALKQLNWKSIESVFAAFDDPRDIT
jgi:hypothetical protein